MTLPIVIIGPGQAGVRAAETLRALGREEPILMFGEEPHPPYQRPPLSKAFLAGEIARERLYLHGSQFFERHAIKLETGRRVLAIEPGARRISVSGHATPVAYGKLLIATGCRPRQLAVPGAEAAELMMLRSIEDAERLRARLETAECPAIVGGGYIGLEAAAILCGMGKPVILLEAQSRLLARVAGPVTSAFFHRLHQARGVDIRLGAKAVRLEKSDAGTVIELSDGERIEADLILVATGAAANDELARQAGLPADDGILVDEFCRAAPDIFAAGDCTRFPLPRYRRHVRLESVQNANDQARAAAEAMAGVRDKPYDPVPWFWSDQHEFKLQIAGLAEGYDEERVEGDPDEGHFAVSYFRGGALIAVDAVNNPRAHMLARKALAGYSAAAASQPE